MKDDKTLDVRNDKQYRAFKKEYLKAKEEKKESFMFEDSEILTKFAFYMLQYVEDMRDKMNLTIYKKRINKKWES